MCGIAALTDAPRYGVLDPNLFHMLSLTPLRLLPGGAMSDNRQTIQPGALV